MKKWKDHWNELLPHEKKFEVAGWILTSLFVISFLIEILDKTNVMPVDMDMFIVAKGILAAANACEAVVCWRKNRSFAHACVACAVVFGLGTVWEIVKLFI